MHEIEPKYPNPNKNENRRVVVCFRDNQILGSISVLRDIKNEITKPKQKNQRLVSCFRKNRILDSVSVLHELTTEITKPKQGKWLALCFCKNRMSSSVLCEIKTEITEPKKPTLGFMFSLKLNTWFSFSCMKLKPNRVYGFPF